jgi:5-methylcytosine-specific restriction protein A
VAVSRSVEEWIGKDDDTPIPPRVRIRVFEKHAGRCYLSGRKIMPGDAWECDHVLAIINGGQNRESNLAPALKAKHRVKSDGDMAIKSKIARTKAKHLGVYPASPFKIKGRPFERRRTAP